jgi:hypothetical protein
MDLADVSGQAAQWCHPGGIGAAHAALMDDIFLCPDCLTEHREPLEAVLGHRARCLSCAMVVEIEVAFEEAPVLELEIHIAA